jgi:exonuclease VII small subunit
MGSQIPGGDNYQNQIRVRADAPALQNPGGSDRFSRMEARVAVLEAGFKRIETTLDRIDTRLAGLEKGVAEVKEGLSVARETIRPLATAEQVAKVATKLDDKPGTWQAVLISLLISGLVVAAALGGAAKFLPK